YESGYRAPSVLAEVITFEDNVLRDAPLAARRVADPGPFLCFEFIEHLGVDVRRYLKPAGIERTLEFQAIPVSMFRITVEPAEIDTTSVAQQQFAGQMSPPRCLECQRVFRDSFGVVLGTRVAVAATKHQQLGTGRVGMLDEPRAQASPCPEVDVCAKLAVGIGVQVLLFGRRNHEEE